MSGKVKISGGNVGFGSELGTTNVITQPSAENRILKYPFPSGPFDGGPNDQSTYLGAHAETTSAWWAFTNLGLDSQLTYASSSFTIEGWVRWPNVPQSGGPQFCGVTESTIRNSGSIKVLGFFRDINGDKSEIRFKGKDFYLSSAKKSIANNIWYHIAVAVRANEALTELTASFFFNGEDAGTSAGYHTIGAAANNTFTVGPNNGGFTTDFMLADEVRFWNILRTQSEIQENKDKQINPATPGLIAYYRFNGNSIDSTGINPDLLGSGSTPSNATFTSSVPF